MPWYDDPLARPYLRVYPQEIDEMRSDLAAAKRARATAASLAAAVGSTRPPTWRSPAAEDHAHEKAGIQRTLKAAVNRLDDLQSELARALQTMERLHTEDYYLFVARKQQLAASAAKAS